jgi:hypothetical protein
MSQIPFKKILKTVGLFVKLHNPFLLYLFPMIGNCFVALLGHFF